MNQLFMNLKSLQTVASKLLLLIVKGNLYLFHLSKNTNILHYTLHSIFFCWPFRGLMEVVVKSPFPQQFFMAALFNDFPQMENTYLISILHGGKPMCDNYTRSASTSLV